MPNTHSVDLNEAPSLAPEEAVAVRLFGRSCQSVVHVTVKGLQSGHGTGFVWDASHIVTSNHVVAGATEVTIRVEEPGEPPREHLANVVGADRVHDVAVLLVNAPLPLPLPRALAHPDFALRVGQRVFAIGSAFGLSQTLTSGCVSGLGREISSPEKSQAPLFNIIQTDAGLNEGSSGGPLFDSNGRVVGITCAIASPSGGFAGVGFAVPIQSVEAPVGEIIATGRARSPTLGLAFVPPRSARKLGLENGLLVGKVFRGGPAEKAGVLPTTTSEKDGRIALGDILVRIDGRPVDTVVDVWRVLKCEKKVGDSVKLTVIRPGMGTMDMDVALEDTLVASIPPRARL